MSKVDLNKAILKERGFKCDKSTVLNLPVSLISPDPNQPRKEFPETEIKRLAKSIEAIGEMINKPNVKRDPAHPGHFILTEGECRFRAVRDVLGWKRISVNLVADTRDAIIAARQIIENNNRIDLTHHEKLSHYIRMNEEMGLSDTEISDLIGCHKSNISKTRSACRMLDALKSEGFDQKQRDSIARLPLRKIYPLSVRWKREPVKVIEVLRHLSSESHSTDKDTRVDPKPTSTKSASKVEVPLGEAVQKLRTRLESLENSTLIEALLQSLTAKQIEKVIRATVGAND